MKEMLWKRVRRERQDAKEATTDPLTTLPNRREFNRRLENAFAELRSPENRSGIERRQNIFFVVADIDKFKHINDSYGHPGGDFVLQDVAKLLRHSIKDIARIGGEEFAFILREVDKVVAIKVAEDLRAQVENHQFMWEGKPIGRVTMSFGVASTEDTEKPEDLYKFADAALYAAKNSGRNRVVSYQRQSVQ